MWMFFQVTEASPVRAAVDRRGKRNTHNPNIYSVYIYICIFGELPLYMHCCCLSFVHGRGQSGGTAVLAAARAGVPEPGDRLRFQRAKPTLPLPQRTTCSLEDAWTAALVSASCLMKKKTKQTKTKKVEMHYICCTI